MPKYKSAVEELDKAFSEYEDKSASVNALALFRNAWGVPDAWQEEVLTSVSSRILLNCSRQAGKSTVTSTLAIDTAVNRSRSLILLLSPTLRQSAELFAKCMTVYNSTQGLPGLVYESKLSLQVTNGSRVIALPGKPETVRGFSAVTLLIIDEAAFCGDPLYRGIRPMLAVSQGKLVLLSTPFGKRGFYYDEYTRRDNWHYIEVPATSIPRITPDFLEEEKIALGPLFVQEYMNTFLDSETAMFDYETVQNALDDGVELWF